MPSSHTPRRIACLQPSATVILDAIGELGRVVACTRYCADVVPEVADGSRVILADSWTADTAQIVAAQPDLVIAAVPYQEKAVSEILKGRRTFSWPGSENAGGYLYRHRNHRGRGRCDGSWRRSDCGHAAPDRPDHARVRTAAIGRPRVWCEEWGKPLIASQRWVAELVEAAGGDFVVTPGTQASAEDIRRLDPEVLIAAWCGAGDRVPLEKMIAQRGWQGTTAARSGRVFCIRDEFLNTPAPTLLQGLEALAFAIHPELFPRTKGIRQITGVPASTAGNSTPVS